MGIGGFVIFPFQASLKLFRAEDGDK